MAFAFFRRRQKMVIIIMAVLMVSFLIGFQGFQMLFERKPGAVVIGTSLAGEIKNDDMWMARSDLEVLQRYVYLGLPLRMSQMIWPTDLAFLAVLNNDSPFEAYALLFKEAQKSGAQVTDSDVDRFLSQTGRAVGTEGYQAMISALTAERTPRSEETVRGALARWLTIHKASMAAQADVPPSEQELQLLYRDLTEKIDLRVVRFPAADFMKDVPDPSDEEIKEQFQKYKDVAPESDQSAESFGFGYRQPQRVRVRYLLISEEAISQVTQPSDKMARDYFLSNQGEFAGAQSPSSRQAPNSTRPSTAPETQVATAPATQPARFSDVKDQIVVKLRARDVQNRLDNILSQLEMLVAEYEKSGVTEQNAYEWAAARMRQPADEALARQVQAVSIRNERLDRAMEILADAAGLRAISYPLGDGGASRLDPSVKVTLTGQNMRLSEALGQIDKQVNRTGLGWSMCKDLDEVLFGACDGIDTFPISVSQTKLVGVEELSDDDLFASSSTASGQPMLAIVEEFIGSQRPGSPAKLQEDGPRMQVAAPKPGRMLWRLVEIAAAHVPKDEELTGDLRKGVIEDIKVTKALEKAVLRAEKLLVSAKKDGLAAAAKSAGLNTTTTGLFSRKSMASPQQQMLLLMRMERIINPETILQFFLAKPYGFPYSDVPEIPLPSQEAKRGFMASAFSLVPEDVEPKVGGEPYPEKPYAVASVKIPLAREVLVMQRVDYRPAVTGQYDQEGRKVLPRYVMATKAWEMRRQWFDLKRITERIKYERVQAQGTSK